MYNYSRDGSEQSGRAGAQGGYPYQDVQGRTFVDTSALGNLAYASGLGRNDSPVQRGGNAEPESKRETSSTYASPQLSTKPNCHGSNSTYQYGQAHTYRSSVTPTTSNAPATLAPYSTSQPTTASNPGQQNYQLSSYTPDIQAPNTYRLPDAQGSAGLQVGYMNRLPEPQADNRGQLSNGSHQVSQSTQIRQQMNSPVISQGRQQSHSTTLFHTQAQSQPQSHSQVHSQQYAGSIPSSRPSSQLSKHPANQTIGLPQNYQNSQKTSGGDMSQRQSKSSTPAHYSPRQSTQVQQASINASTTGIPQQAARRPEKENRPAANQQQYSTTSHKPMVPNPTLTKFINSAENAHKAGHGQPLSASPYSQIVEAPTGSGHMQDHGETEYVPTEEYLTTAHPSQVFNQSEYMRRKAEAQSAQQKELDQSRQKPTDTTKVGAAPTNNNTPTLKPKSQNSDLKKEKREAELRELFGSMFGQMRELKSKDPVMFLEIWEEFKRGQPPPRALSQACQTKDGPANATSQKVQSPIVADGQFPSPRASQSKPIPATNTAPTLIAQAPAAKPEIKSDFIEELANSSNKQGIQGQTSSTSPMNYGASDASTSALLLSSVPLQLTNGQVSSSTSTQLRGIAQPNGVQLKTGAGTHVRRRTNWPETSKAPIAYAAAEFFKSEPENEGKPLDPKEVISWLDSGPTYDGFCEIFESRGFQVHRGAFAQALLKAVPPADAPKTIASTQPSTTKLFTAYTKGLPEGPLKPYTNEALKNRSVSTLSPSTFVEGTPTKRTAPDISNSKGVQASKRKPSLANTSVSQLSVPKSKQEMARKRSFNEIVDLSQVSDDDPPLSKQLKLQGAETDIPNNLPSLGAAEKIKTGAPRESPAATGYSTPQSTSGEPVIKDTHIPTTDHTKDRARTDKVVDLIDKGKTRKSRYNVKTIARDILIASGRHRDELALNFHLFSLRETFRDVTDDADLSTLRWDIIDPVGPPSRSPKVAESDPIKGRPADIPNVPKLTKRPRGCPTVQGSEKSQLMIDPKDKEHVDASNVTANDHPRDIASPREELEGDTTVSADSETDVAQPTRPMPRRAPITTIDRVVEMADETVVGLHPGHLKAKYYGPKPRVVNPSQGIAIKSAATNKSTPYTFGTPTVHMGQAPSRPSAPNVSSAAIQSAEPARGQPSPSQPPMSPSVRVPPPQHPHLLSTPSPTPRRGRPPGSKNKSSVNRDVSKTTDTPEDKRRGRLPGSTNRSSITSGSRRGTHTPSSLRRSAIPDDGIEVRVSSRSSSVVVPTHIEEPWTPFTFGKNKRKRGEEKPPTPPFVVFECQWKDCPAKLHNLEILRKHVFKVHGKPAVDGTHVCRWGKCSPIPKEEGEDVSMEEEQPEPVRHQFLSLESWKEHVESHHICYLAWTLGDGPTTHPKETRRTDYLNDSSGRQVTPIIMEPPHSASSNSTSTSYSSRPTRNPFSIHSRTTAANGDKIDTDDDAPPPSNPSKPATVVKVVVPTPRKTFTSFTQVIDLEGSEEEKEREVDLMSLLDGIPDHGE